MQVSFENGISLRIAGQDFCIDPHRKINSETFSIISHAHSDHTHLRQNSTHHCSKETKGILNEKFKKSELKILDSKAKFKKDSIEVSLHSAGHILGSNQIQFVNGCNVVVTSDFKLQDDLLLDGAKVLESDVLIIESTFGKPEFVFPPREEVFEKMQRWCQKELKDNKKVILSGYALGKAQEITKFCNDYLSESPGVYASVFRNNQLYEQEGAKLGGYELLEGNLNDFNVLIIPPFNLNNGLRHAIQLSSTQKISTAFCTGWTFRYGFDQLFPLSDHADFTQLLHYVEQSHPKQVYTIYGFAQEFAQFINKKLGIKAKPLEEANQKDLTDFV